MNKLQKEERQLTIFDIVEIEQEEVKQTAATEETKPLNTGTDNTETPKINGYTPGHPWYYKLGGEIIAVENIPPKEFRRDKFDPIKRRNGKPNPSLRVQLSDARKSLERDIARYKEIIEKQDTFCSESDLRSGYDWKFNLSLVYNHVSYYKGLVLLLEKMTRKIEF